MQLTLKQWGNSSGILLPRELMKKAGIKQNDTLEARRFTKLAQINDFDIMNISDAVMGIFDYQ